MSEENKKSPKSNDMKVEIAKIIPTKEGKSKNDNVLNSLLALNSSPPPIKQADVSKVESTVKQPNE